MWLIIGIALFSRLPGGLKLHLTQLLQLHHRETDQHRAQHPRHRRRRAEPQIAERLPENVETDDFGLAVRRVRAAAGHREDVAPAALNYADHHADEIDRNETT